MRHLGTERHCCRPLTDVCFAVPKQLATTKRHCCRPLTDGVFVDESLMFVCGVGHRTFLAFERPRVPRKPLHNVGGFAPPPFPRYSFFDLGPDPGGSNLDCCFLVRGEAPSLFQMSLDPKSIAKGQGRSP